MESVAVLSEELEEASVVEWDLVNSNTDRAILELEEAWALGIIMTSKILTTKRIARAHKVVSARRAVE